MKTIRILGQFNVARLTDELQAAFPDLFPQDDPANPARITVLSDESGLTLLIPDELDEQAIRTLTDAHNPDLPSWGELIEARRKAAQDNARQIPGWATWSETEASAWFQEHVQDTLSMIPGTPRGLTQVQLVAVIEDLVDVVRNMAQAQRAMGQMLLAVRDELWPSLGVEGERED